MTEKFKLKRAPSFWDVLKFCAVYWKKQPRKIAFVVAMQIAAALFETNLPNMLSNFLGAIRHNDQANAVWHRLEFFIGNYIAYIALYWFSSMVYNAFECRVFKDLRDDAFVHAHRLPEQFYANTFTGSIISKINRGRNRIESFEDQFFMQVLPTVVILIGSMGFLSLRFPVLAAIVFGYILVLLTIGMFLVFKFVGPSQAEYASSEDVYNAHLADSISGIATTRSFAQEGREIGRFVEITESLRKKNWRAYGIANFTGFLQKILLAGMLTFLLGGGTWYFLHGKATVEDMAYLTLAYTIMHSYVRSISDNIKTILTSSYDLHAIMTFMREDPSVKDASNATALAIKEGVIEFKDVTFTYPGKQFPVFENFSLSIKAGERVALVGHSGSGKTSFARLLQRAYDVQAGHIFIDGQDIAHGTQQSLRSSIAAVPQDPVLFHRTLKDNIAYARPQASFEEVRAAALKAHIDDFIMQLPQQYDMLVGERGVKLSGGERQRVAIARALLADRPILILDEATSSLDSESEKVIQDALRTLIHGRTSIMIAHRLSTILDADRILVFDHGRIVEQGTHRELLARGGVYAGFFDLQSGGLMSDKTDFVPTSKRTLS